MASACSRLSAPSRCSAARACWHSTRPLSFPLLLPCALPLRRPNGWELGDPCGNWTGGLAKPTWTASGAARARLRPRAAAAAAAAAAVRPALTARPRTTTPSSICSLRLQTDISLPGLKSSVPQTRSLPPDWTGICGANPCSAAAAAAAPAAATTTTTTRLRGAGQA